MPWCSVFHTGAPMLLQGREADLSAGGRLKSGYELTGKGHQSLPPARRYSAPLAPA